MKKIHEKYRRLRHLKDKEKWSNIQKIEVSKIEATENRIKALFENSSENFSKMIKNIILVWDH